MPSGQLDELGALIAIASCRREVKQHILGRNHARGQAAAVVLALPDPRPHAQSLQFKQLAAKALAGPRAQPPSPRLAPSPAARLGADLFDIVRRSPQYGADGGFANS